MPFIFRQQTKNLSEGKYSAQKNALFFIYILKYLVNISVLLLLSSILPTSLNIKYLQIFLLKLLDIKVKTHPAY